MITSTAFAGQHYAVLGLARSGLATVDALLASGAKVTAWDDREEARENLRSLGTNDLAIADFVGGDLTPFDSIVVTPGLPLNRHPIAAAANAAGVEIIGDIELFARARPELPPHKVVGITGTNGKSTTTALVHHILRTAGVPSLMGGNIGLPILAQDPLPEGGVYVLELSSYQIDLTHSLDCDVAVLLNITPDHLDRYESFEAYAASKARLFAMQSEAGRAVVLGEDESSLRVANLVSNRVVPTAMGSWIGSGVCLIESTQIRLFSKNRVTPNTLLFDGADMYGDQSIWSALQGPHNARNVVAAMAAAYALATHYGVVLSDEALGQALETYPGLPHRMERVAEKDGVLFVNDSKATNATATAPALAAFPAIRWILGGQAKSDDLDDCAPFFGHVRSAYTIGEASELFARLLGPHLPVAECGTLDAAVRAAAHDARPGDTVLLSPACASFDQYKDFEARGDAFREYVSAL